MPLRLPDCFRTRWIALGAIPLTFACHEASTAPDRDRFAPPGAPTRDASPGTVQGPVHIPIAETNAVGWGTLPWTGTGMTVPSWTSYIVKVSGRTTVSPNPDVLQCRPDYPPPYGAEGSYGPSGDRYYQLRVEPGLITSAGVGSVGLRYDGVGTTGSDNAQSDTAFAWDGGEIAMRRSGIQGSTNSSTGCVVWLYSLSSAQTISLVTLDGQELSVTPSWVAVRKGTVVSFRATSRGVLVNAPHWRFDADPGVVNQTTACGLSGPNPCAVTVQNSGTLRVASNVQGRMRAASAQVRVYSTFALDADRAEILAGDTVTFTPRYDGTKGPAERWRWMPDSVIAGDGAPCTDGSTECRKQMVISGSMWAFNGRDSASVHVTVGFPTLDLSATAVEVAEGDSVLFTGSLSPSVSNYRVESWTWKSDTPIPVVASRIPSSAALGSSVSAPRPSSDTAPADSSMIAPGDTVNATQDDAPDTRDDRPEPTACMEYTMSCEMSITKPGMVTLAVNVAGRTLTKSVHVAVKYVCPDDFPSAFVPDVAPILVQAKTTVIKWMAGVPVLTPLGTHLTSQKGPWTLVQDFGYDPRIGLPRGRYRPSEATNDLGFAHFDRLSTWAEFSCQVSLKKPRGSNSVEYVGLMHYLNRMNVNWITP